MTDYTRFSVLSSKHSNKLAREHEDGGKHHLGIGQKWVTAEKIAASLERAGDRLAIIFTDAEAHEMRLVYWGFIDGITVSSQGRWTDCHYSDLHKIAPSLAISTMVLAKDDRPVSDDFQRAYAVCYCPDFVAD